MTDLTRPDPTPDPTAQDVIDALRFALMAQKDQSERLRLVDTLLELAPESDGDSGTRLIIDMILVGSLKVALTDA